MSALELVTLVSQSVFVLLFVRVAIPAARAPTRARVDTAVFFGALTAIILAGRLGGLISPELSAPVATASAALAMALPFLLLRLAADFVPVRARSLRAAATGLALAVVTIALVPS